MTVRDARRWRLGVRTPAEAPISGLADSWRRAGADVPRRQTTRRSSASPSGWSAWRSPSTRARCPAPGWRASFGSTRRPHSATSANTRPTWRGRSARRRASHGWSSPARSPTRATSRAGPSRWRTSSSPLATGRRATSRRSAQPKRAPWASRSSPTTL